MSPSRHNPVESVDVLIIGAGISGIGAAYYLQRDEPDKSFAIVEGRDRIGGTWDLHTYPGARSDSDLFTFGYEFKPWKGDSVADAESILEYLGETTREIGIADEIEFHTKVVAASWDSGEACWTVDLEDTHTGERRQVRCAWMFNAAGYYDYEQPFSPEFPGRADFEAAGGTVVHPQHWGGVDCRDKKVVVIGSGATAITLIPALAGPTAHVTMLQRSPSYIISLPAKDKIADLLRAVLPEDRAHALIRRKNVVMQRLSWRFCQRFPRVARAWLRRMTAKQLPDGYPVDEHFAPRYNPWDQRLCMAPDGDFFAAISSGEASVVTDTIERFTANGILLTSGKHLDADVIVTATGLNLRAFGGVEYTVDGAPVVLTDTLAYKGMMLTGVPNNAFAIGYTNASWTLKVGLLAEHFTRLLDHMDSAGYDVCVPVRPDAIETRPLLDFQAGYVQRALDRLPKQGPGFPWLTSADFVSDSKLLRHGPVNDPNLRFSCSGRGADATAGAGSGAAPGAIARDASDPDGADAGSVAASAAPAPDGQVPA